MNRSVFTARMISIADAHQKSFKAAMLDMIFADIQQYPDTFADFILTVCKDQEDLPRNFYRYVTKDLLQRWIGSQGKRWTTDQCPECNSGMPGWFTCWQDVHEGAYHRFMVKCGCGAAQGFNSGIGPMSKAQATCFGYIPIANGQNETDFEIARGITERGINTKFTPRILRATDSRRERHKEVLAETEQ